MMNAPRELKKIFGTLLELHTAHDDGTFPPDIYRLEDIPKSPAMVLVVCDCDQWFNGWRPKKDTLDRMTAELGSKPRWWSERVTLSWYTGCGKSFFCSFGLVYAE